MSHHPVPSVSQRPKSIKSIHHVKLPCHSINDTLDFYTRVFPLEYMPEYDHFTPNHQIFAKMMRHGDTIIELRYRPVDAHSQRGWDPITWAVGNRADLEAWGTWLDACTVKRSKIFVGVKSWVMCCEDPDGRIVRLFVDDEEHEWTDEPDQHEEWLGSVSADPNIKQTSRSE